MFKFITGFFAGLIFSIATIVLAVIGVVIGYETSKPVKKSPTRTGPNPFTP